MSTDEKQTTPNISGSVQDQPEETRSGAVEKSLPGKAALREDQKK